MRKNIRKTLKKYVAGIMAAAIVIVNTGLQPVLAAQTEGESQTDVVSEQPYTATSGDAAQASQSGITETSDAEASMETSTAADEAETQEYVTEAAVQVHEAFFEEENYTVQFRVETEWNTGYNAVITITNTCNKPIDNWYLSFKLDDEIKNLQSGKITAHEEKVYLVKNAGWNKDIPVSGSVSFTYTAEKTGEFACIPQEYSMDTELMDVAENDFQTDFTVWSDWGAGFTSVLTITNTSQNVIEDWKLLFTFDGNITGITGGELVMSENNLYEVDAFSYDYGIEPGQTRNIQIIGNRSDSGIVPENIMLKTVEYHVQEPDVPVIPDTPLMPDDSELEAECDRMAEINGGVMPVMYLDEEDDIPCFISGKYSDIKVTDYESAIYSLEDITYIMEIDWENISFNGVSIKTYGDRVYYRLQQMYKGLEVSGKGLIVITDTEGNIVTLSGDFDPIYDMDASVIVDEQDAQKAAEQVLGVQPDKGRLIWYSIEEGYDEPAWYFEGNDMCVYISATYGDDIMSYSIISESQEYLKTSGGETFIAEFDEEKEVYALYDRIRNIEVRGTGSISYENNLEKEKDAVKIQNHDISELAGLIQGKSSWYITSEGKFMYDVSYSSSAEWKNELDAEYMVYAEKVYDFFLETLGLAGYDNKGSLLRIAFDSSYVNNAFADLNYGYYTIPYMEYVEKGIEGGTAQELEPYKQSMAIIRITPEYYNKDNIGVLAHEYGHSIEASVKDGGVLLAKGETKTIKEAFADCMAELMDCSINNNEEWRYFDRDIANCRKYISQTEYKLLPDSVESEYYSEANDAHLNSTVISNLVYRLYKQGFASPAEMTEWLYRSLYYLPEDAKFVHLRYSLVAAAQEMGFDAKKVMEEFDNAGIYEQICNPKGWGIVDYTIKVTDNHEIPIEKAIITYIQSNKKYVAYTDENGYAYIKLKNKDTKILVQKYGYNIADVKYNRSDINSESVVVKLFELTVYDKDKVQITGDVLNSINNQRLSQVTIKLRQGVNVTSGHVYDEVKVDSSGNYKFEKVSSGMYTMEISKDGYITQFQTIVVGARENEYTVFLTPKMSSGELRVVLSWADNPRDLDAHMVCYDNGYQRYHIAFFNESYKDEANLDYDVTYGRGPETITIKYNSQYEYRYYVHWFSGSGTWSTSNAKVYVYYNNRQIGIFNATGDGGNKYEWHVFTFKNGKIYKDNVM